jgi:hypothetical protein
MIGQQRVQADVKQVTPVPPRQGYVKPRASKRGDVTEKDSKCHRQSADHRGTYGQAHPSVEKGRQSPERGAQEQVLAPGSRNPDRKLRIGERAAEAQNSAGQPDPHDQRGRPDQLCD